MSNNSKLYNVLIHDYDTNTTHLYQSTCTLEAAIVAADEAIKSKDFSTETIQIKEHGTGITALEFSKDNPPDPNGEVYTLTIIDFAKNDIMAKCWFTSRKALYEKARRFPYKLRHDYLVQLWRGDVKEYMETLW